MWNQATDTSKPVAAQLVAEVIISNADDILDELKSRGFVMEKRHGVLGKLKYGLWDQPKALGKTVGAVASGVAGSAWSWIKKKL